MNNVKSMLSHRKWAYMEETLFNNPVALLGLGSFDHNTSPVWKYLTWAKDINCIFLQIRTLDWKSDDIHPTTWIALMHHVPLHGVTMSETGTRSATNLRGCHLQAAQRREMYSCFSVAVAFIFNWMYIFVTACSPFLTMWVSGRSLNTVFVFTTSWKIKWCVLTM